MTGAPRPSKRSGRRCSRLPAAVRGPPTTAPRSPPAWRISASAPFIAATRPNIPTICLRLRFERWGVVGINIRAPRLAETLGAARRALHAADPRGRQHRSARHRQHRRASSTARTGRSRRSPCSPRRRSTSVTLTVTEKGYCHTPASGELDLDNRPTIVHDLAEPGEPRKPAGPDRARARAAHGVRMAGR